MELTSIGFEIFLYIYESLLYLLDPGIPILCALYIAYKLLFLIIYNVARAKKNYHLIIRTSTFFLRFGRRNKFYYLTRSWAYEQLQQYQEAIHDCNQVLSFNPNNYHAYNMRAVVLTHLKQYTQALQDLEHALRLKPDFMQAHVNKSFLYMETRDYDQAIQTANTVIHLKPKAFAGYHNRAYIYIRLKQYNQALLDLETALKLNYKSALSHNNMGLCLHYLKQYPQAVQCYAQALALDPNNTSTLHNIGLTLLSLNKIEQGRANLLKSLASKPDHICPLWLSEWCNLCFDPFDAAIITRLENAAAIEIDKNSPEYTHKPLCHSVALWLQQNYQEALIAIDQALEIEADNDDAHFWRGMALAALKRDEEAREAFEFARQNGTPLCLFQTLRLLEPLNKPFYQQYTLALQQN